MTSYAPADGPFIGSPPCRHCGANYYLHGPAAVTRDVRRRLADAGRLPCPNGYREQSFARAESVLRDAVASGDETRIFAARGDVQRLAGPCGVCTHRHYGRACQECGCDPYASEEDAAYVWAAVVDIEEGY